MLQQGRIDSDSIGSHRLFPQRWGKPLKEICHLITVEKRKQIAHERFEGQNIRINLYFLFSLFLLPSFWPSTSLHLKDNSSSCNLIIQNGTYSLVCNTINTKQPNAGCKELWRVCEVNWRHPLNYMLPWNKSGSILPLHTSKQYPNDRKYNRPTLLNCPQRTQKNV